MPDYPQMYPARQRLYSAPIADIPATVRAELRRAGLAEAIRPGQRVAITAGSRGINNIAAILKATVEAVRANTVPILKRMTDGDWRRIGQHTESGPYGAEDWLAIYAEHLEKHSRQIEGNLAAWSGR